VLNLIAWMCWAACEAPGVTFGEKAILIGKLTTGPTEDEVQYVGDHS
jgi:hypothetical protein